MASNILEATWNPAKYVVRTSEVRGELYFNYLHMPEPVVPSRLNPNAAEFYPRGWIARANGHGHDVPSGQAEKEEAAEEGNEEGVEVGEHEKQDGEVVLYKYTGYNAGQYEEKVEIKTDEIEKDVEKENVGSVEDGKEQKVDSVIDGMDGKKEQKETVEVTGEGKDEAAFKRDTGVYEGNYDEHVRSVYKEEEDEQNQEEGNGQHRKGHDVYEEEENVENLDEEETACCFSGFKCLWNLICCFKRKRK